jgi:hypothetical protein
MTFRGKMFSKNFKPIGNGKLGAKIMDVYKHMSALFK